MARFMIFNEIVMIILTNRLRLKRSSDGMLTYCETSIFIRTSNKHFFLINEKFTIYSILF